MSIQEDNRQAEGMHVIWGRDNVLKTDFDSTLQQFRLQIIFCLLPTLFEIIMHSSSGRNYDSGAFKRKKKHKLDGDAQSQYGALDKYVVKGPQTNSKNQTTNANIDDGQDVNAVDVKMLT
ncbi:zinc finger MYM-type protein 1-like [Hordeum vulgare]|nr:zinc finger MYM-type protein 1-like [Hordeum vulgare]